MISLDHNNSDERYKAEYEAYMKKFEAYEKYRKGLGRYEKQERRTDQLGHRLLVLAFGNMLLAIGNALISNVFGGSNILTVVVWILLAVWAIGEIVWFVMRHKTKKLLKKLMEEKDNCGY